jgi:hypothetical protein
VETLGQSVLRLVRQWNPTGLGAYMIRNIPIVTAMRGITPVPLSMIKAISSPTLFGLFSYSMATTPVAIRTGHSQQLDLEPGATRNVPIENMNRKYHAIRGLRWR